MRQGTDGRDLNPLTLGEGLSLGEPQAIRKAKGRGSGGATWPATRPSSDPLGGRLLPLGEV